jgi:polysaccharide biosynthesis transport protein
MPKDTSKVSKPPTEISQPSLDYGESVLQSLGGIIRRQKIIIFASICLITGLTALISFKLPPKYAATAEVIVSPRQSRFIGVDTMVDQSSAARAMVESELKIITSKSQAQQVVEKLNLTSDPEFNPYLRDGQGQLVPYERQFEETVAHFLRKLEAGPSGQSYVILIKFTSSDPEKAARITNTVAEAYVAGNTQEKVEAISQAGDLMAKQVEELRQRVMDSERAVAEFHDQHGLVGRQAVSLDTEEALKLGAQLIVLRADLGAKEAKLRQIRRLRSRGESYESVAEVMSSPIIRDLRQEQSALIRKEAQLSKEYGSRHPRLLELNAEKEKLYSNIDAQVRNIILGLENEVEGLRGQEQALSKAIEDAKNRSAIVGKDEVKLNELERQAEANRSLYQTFLSRRMDLREQKDLVRPESKLISRAYVPQEPFLKPMVMTSVGFTGSLLIGVLLACLVDRLNSSLRTGWELEHVLGVPSFGLVPLVRGVAQKKVYRYLLDKPLSRYSEAIRAVQNATQLSSTDQSAQVVLVTSTLPDEGKTTLAVSLAASAARSGLRAIVVDLDLRRPSVAREFDNNSGPGLSEFLTGNAMLDEIIHTPQPDLALHFIPTEKSTSNPVDLLQSRKMVSLLRELRDRYEYIILDTPPALGLTDVKVAALLADVVLYAVQWNKTTAKEALNGITALTSSYVSVTGLVLTRVDLKRHTSHGYGDVATYYGKYKDYFVD